MDTLQKQRFIQRIAAANQLDATGTKIRWSSHAITELVNDQLTRTDIEQALLDCELIEDYPHLNRPLPDCLVLAWLSTGKPVHVVAAMDEKNDRVFVVTVYSPSRERWKDDWKTRR